MYRGPNLIKPLSRCEELSSVRFDIQTQITYALGLGQLNERNTKKETDDLYTILTSISHYRLMYTRTTQIVYENFNSIYSVFVNSERAFLHTCARSNVLCNVCSRQEWSFKLDNSRHIGQLLKVGQENQLKYISTTLLPQF